MNKQASLNKRGSGTAWYAVQPVGGNDGTATNGLAAIGGAFSVTPKYQCNGWGVGEKFNEVCG